MAGIWIRSPALFEEHSRGSLNWIKLSSEQLYSLIWGQRKFHPYSFERVSSCLHPHDSYISGSLQLWQCFSHPLIICLNTKRVLGHPKSLFFNLCRSDGIDKLHYFLFLILIFIVNIKDNNRFDLIATKNKGIVYPKLKILSLFTHPHVIPSLYLLCSVK